MNLVLSLFPGIGLLDLAFEQAGYCVVRGPDKLWGGDVRTFHPPPCRFDGVIGGPPCQAFSQLRHIVEHNRKQNPERYTKVSENLIPEYERVVSEARPTWFLMENVPEAPAAAVDGYHVHSFMLNNRWLGEDQNRLRRFSFGHRERMVDLTRYIEVTLFESPVFEHAVAAAGNGKAVPVRMNSGGTMKRGLEERNASTRTIADYCRLQGLPDDFLDDAPFTTAGKRQVLGNGVPLPMGRALASAIQHALREEQTQ